jgi:hypothetical protein
VSVEMLMGLPFRNEKERTNGRGRRPESGKRRVKISIMARNPYPALKHRIKGGELVFPLGVQTSCNTSSFYIKLNAQLEPISFH